MSLKTTSPKIPHARELLMEALTFKMSLEARELIRQALALMWRDTPVRRAADRKTPKIDDAMRRKIKKLAADSDMTMTEIAEQVGLRNVGRVSEVLKGLR